MPAGCIRVFRMIKRSDYFPTSIIKFIIAMDT